MSALPYDDLTSDIAVWLSRFVRDEVRPLLLRACPAARAALDCWLAMHAEQKQRVSEWESRRSEFMSQSPTLPADSWHGLEPPGEGFTWCERWRDPTSGELRLIRGWVPPGLGECDQPPVDWPLPPPNNRDLSDDECWAALVAVHDEARDPREWIGPTGCRPFDELRRRVVELTEGHLPELQLMLRQLTAYHPQTLAADAAPINPCLPGGTQETDGGLPADKPDGPFGVNQFRFAGVEVSFGRAMLRYRLVLALWDTERNQPAEARPVEDVVEEVWGEENQTNETAFRQLCSDTRRQFDAANCLLDIEHTGGIVRLFRR